MDDDTGFKADVEANLTLLSWRVLIGLAVEASDLLTCAGCSSNSNESKESMESKE